MKRTTWSSHRHRLSVWQNLQSPLYKTLNKWGIERNSPNLKKSIYKKPTANIILNTEMVSSDLAKYQVILDKGEEKTSRLERSKTISVHRWHEIVIENLTKSTNTQKQKQKMSSATMEDAKLYKNYLYFCILIMSNSKWNLQMIPLILVSKGIRHLGINLTIKT